MEFQEGERIAFSYENSVEEIRAKILYLSEKYAWIDILFGQEELGIRRLKIGKIEMVQDGKDSMNLKTIRLKTDSVSAESKNKFGERIETLYQRISREKEPNKVKEILRDLLEL